MTFAEFFGCTLIAFGPSLAIFCISIASDPLRVIILISGSFFWLLSLLLSSIVWAILIPLKQYLIVGVTFSVLFQELFRYLFFLLLRTAESGLKKVSEIGFADNKAKTNDRTQLSFVSGFGFGLMSGAFSIINILADSYGPGTVGINGDSHYFFLCSALTTSIFILLNIAWTVILFYACDNNVRYYIGYVVISHLIATYITFLNPKQFYGISIPLETILLVLTIAIALRCANFKFLQPKCD